MHRFLATLVAITVARAASAQPSDDPRDRAAALYEEGRRHFDVQDYAAAVVAWKQAYLLASEPLLLFNIGQALRLSGDCAQANRYYLNYKEAAPDPANRDELDAAMAKCAGVDPAIGDREPQAPVPVVAEPVQQVSAKPIELPASNRPWRIAGASLAGTGVVLVATATYFAIHEHALASAISSAPAGSPWASYAATDRAAHTSSIAADVIGAIGIAALAGGGALWWTHREDPTRVAVSIGANHLSASVSCAF